MREPDSQQWPGGRLHAFGGLAPSASLWPTMFRQSSVEGVVRLDQTPVGWSLSRQLLSSRRPDSNRGPLHYEGLKSG
jgi:hypothetical protein